MQSSHSAISLQQKIKKLIRGFRQNLSELPDHPFARLLRRTVGTTCLLSEKSLRRCEQRPSPTIFASVLVVRINKIFRHDISAHLKACQVGIKFSSHLRTCKSACRTQITSDKTSLTPQYVKNTFLDAPSLRIWENTPAIVAEIRPPLTAYERSLTVEKLAVGAVMSVENAMLA